MDKDKHRINLVRQKERVAFDLKDLVAGTEELLRSTASYTGAEIEEARRRLRNQLDMARDTATVWNQAAVERYRHATDATDEYVRDRPWTFVAVALAVGIAAGYCLKEDRHRR